MHVGTMGDSDPLVTLVVSEDRSVVAQECRHVTVSGTVAALQGIADPCHHSNNGRLQSAAPSAFVHR